METIIFILIFGALIQSFLHCTRGKIHIFDKMFGGLYSFTFIILTVFSIVKYGIKCLWIMPLVFFVSNFLFVTIFDKLFKNNKHKFEQVDYLAHIGAMKKLLRTMINNIYNGNYTYDFVNGSYTYSSEITDIFNILNDDIIKKIYNNSISNYSSKTKRELDKMDPFTFNLEECIIYLNYLWHIEGSGLATGIILKRIEDNRYLFTLGKLNDLL